MNIKNILKAGSAALVLTGLLAAPMAHAQTKNVPGANSKIPQRVMTIEVGDGEQINLPVGISDVVVSNPGIADVDVRSPKQIYIFGKTAGQSTIYATDAAGRTVYSVQVEVAQNINSVGDMLKLAMPEADIKVSFLGGMVLLTGTVAQPEDIVEAEDLARAFIGDKQQNGDPVRVISRLKTAVPMQVNLQVRIAEVSRSLAKEIASNFKTRDNDGNNFLFGVGRGRDAVDISNTALGSGLPVINACTAFGLPNDCGLRLPFNPQTGQFLTDVGTTFTFKNTGNNALNIAGRLFGLDVGAAFDFAERSGLSSTLAQPNLTTISGETAEFLAGGQFPIPVADNFGAVTVQFRDFGVSLRYTPTVQADGRILLRVRPEVSDISSQGAVRIPGTEIPAITTRMAETTVELGSGQSFMIAGLLSNAASSSVDKYPGLGDVPVLGALFKSNGWKRNETELVIVVTPYLVKPVSEAEIKLPTDGLTTPTDLERVLMNKTIGSDAGKAERPMPTVAPEATGPDFGSVSEAAPSVSKKQAKKAEADANSAPGFSFN